MQTWEKLSINYKRHDNHKFMTDLNLFINTNDIIDYVNILKYYKGYYEHQILSAFQQKAFLEKEDKLQQIVELADIKYVEMYGIFQITFEDRLEAEIWLNNNKVYHLLKSHTSEGCYRILILGLKL